MITKKRATGYYKFLLVVIIIAICKAIYGIIIFVGNDWTQFFGHITGGLLMSFLLYSLLHEYSFKFRPLTKG